MNVDFLPEVEEVWFLSHKPRPFEDVNEALLVSGFTLDEDLFVIDRKGKFPIWQSGSIASAYIYLGDSELFDGTGEVWDRVRLCYQLSRLPANLVGDFSLVAAEVSARLGLPMTLHGEVIASGELVGRLQEYVDEVRQNLGEPGSKDVAIFIESLYPR